MENWRLDNFVDHPYAEHWSFPWLAGLAVTVVVALFVRSVLAIVINRLERLSKIRALDFIGPMAAVLRRTRFIFDLAIGLWVASRVVTLDAEGVRIVGHVVMIAIFIQIGLWGAAIVDQIIAFYRERLEDDPAQTTALTAMGFLSKALVWMAVLLLVIDNLGFDITALVASLGIGGVAVALATQNILGDLFASLSIVIDKPFVIGDFIIVGSDMGTVERIGLKTTRVKSLGGEQLVFSNGDLLKSRIRNFKRMEERRIVFNFGVVYQTSTEQVEAIPAMVREIVESRALTRFDRAHFHRFGSSSLDFEVVYFVLVPDYNAYMDVQQEIVLALLRRFRERGIEFAYPTRTVWLEREGEGDEPEDGRSQPTGEAESSKEAMASTAA